MVAFRFRLLALAMLLPWLATNTASAESLEIVEGVSWQPLRAQVKRVVQTLDEMLGGSAHQTATGRLRQSLGHARPRRRGGRRAEGPRPAVPGGREHQP